MAGVTAVGALAGCQGTADRGRTVHAASKSANAAPAASDGSLDGLTAPEISRRLWDTMNGVNSMTMGMSGVLQGRQVQVKIAATRSGACAAAVRLNGGAMQVIRTADKVSYIKGDAAYWTSLGARGKTLGGLAADRWIRFPGTSAPGKRLSRSCDVANVVKTLQLEHDSATAGARATVDGKSVVTIKKKDRSGAITYYVAAQGPSYLLKLTDQTGLTMTFGSFDKPVNVAAPPANRTIDISRLGGDDGLGLDA
ncbi:hypothetical protein [Streptomyces sp. H39-S7]|uniref:hypothetical protein n=1 Tax=Streptomyces sp. H39-S7 TaxID=3004357 RepID=UPI0022AE6403|nr:hypothetical protein [Streptomyces sp. H39-S7]MCZ4120116.1 hypothetical protein [Streptomyces sp. H39-S7]